MLLTNLKPSPRVFRLVTISFALIAVGIFLNRTYGTPTHIPLSIPQIPGFTAEKHPIEELIAKAEADFESVLRKETKTLGDTAKAYRKRRGRHPPPGFEAWYNFATEKNAVMVEDFFDRIYDDLGPFWGMQPLEMRQKANAFGFKIAVRNGTVTQTDTGREWMDLWLNLIETVAEHLPDVDVPINTMDEPRMLVPWETIDDYMQDSRKYMPPAEEITEEFSGLDMVDHANYTFDPEWKGPRQTWPEKHAGPRPYWSLVQPACPPDSPARRTPLWEDIWHEHPRPEHAASLLLPVKFPNHTYHGYVQNWTLATDPCQFPYLQGLHGTFVEPQSMATSTQLFPLFGGSKLPMNNEILFPPAMYWSEREMYSGGEGTHGVPWERKQNSIIWRGAATGGRNKEETWNRFQRHRFVSMLNWTQVAAAELTLRDDAENIAGIGPGGNFRLLPHNPYKLTKQDKLQLGSWIAEIADGEFMDLLCFPGEDAPTCSYTNNFYAIAEMMPMSEQYSYKYLPDIDGNSFSGRFRGFMRSNSLPIKATVYKEWHDSRLWPWVHFVPMDNTFVDFYGIMEYFLGSEPSNEPTSPEEQSDSTPSTEQLSEPNANVPLPSTPDATIELEKSDPGSDTPPTKRSHLLPRFPQNPTHHSHDSSAQKIASAGQAWAEKVLRREDMQIYVFRLLLEYARASDDRRERLGWAGDLLAEQEEENRKAESNGETKGKIVEKVPRSRGKKLRMTAG